MDRNLLTKFLKGHCTPDEARKVIRWAESDQFKPELTQFLQSEWSSVPDAELSNQDTEALFESIMGKAQATDTNTAMPHKRVKRIQWWRYAAVLALVAVTAWGLWQWTATKNSKPAGELVALSTPMGQKKTVLLADGSEVVLNANSSIQFASQFSDSARIIELQGEAYFKVAKDPSRPFTVIARDVWTTALGTEFNVNAVGEVKVALNEGKIAVYKTNDQGQKDTEWILNPGEKITYLNSGGYQISESFSRIQETGWVEGILFFRDQSFAEVMRELSKWYGVEFSYEGKPIDKTYSGSFKNESLDNVLSGISFSLGFEYQIIDNQVYINKK